MQRILRMFGSSSPSAASGVSALHYVDKAVAANHSFFVSIENAFQKVLAMAGSGEDDEKSDISGGLVEIAALTALIGGSTAESLGLGSRGACGLPWAALSSFGSIFVVKACISACTPAWLRETIGVRSMRSDSAVGCSRSLKRRSNDRRMTGEATGVMVEWSKNKENTPSLNIKCDHYEDVHAFDEWTAGPLRSCTSLLPGEPLRSHFYMRDPQWPQLYRSQIKADWIFTGLTLIKVVEPYLLYRYGSSHIFWITAVNWAYFFVCAVLLQVFNFGRESLYDKRNRCIDVVAGKLPTPQVIGGERKVLLDVPINLRKSRLWQSMWTLGLVVSIGCLVATYALLTKEPSVCFHLWLIFQIVWLGLRSIFFYFARETDDMQHVVTPVISEKHRPTQFNFRLLGLSAALSKHQALNHPRGAYCYSEDLQDPNIIKSYLDEAGLEFSDQIELPSANNVSSKIELQVAAVIGDTVLSSVAWLMGSTLTGMDVYDCCILVLRSSEKITLVPACRVLSGRVNFEEDADPESTIASIFLPKGVSNNGKDISWRYWIPYGEKKWAFYSTPWATSTKQALGSLGKKELIVASSDDVTQQLETGELLVSLSSVKDVEDAVAQSAAVARILKEMLLGAPRAY